MPQGWEELEEPHPESGVVAKSYRRFQHTDGSEIIIWSDVTEDATDYTVEEADEYAVELYDGTGEYIEGDSFETREAAENAAHEALKKFPQEKA
jgi:hypothetical protein